MATFLLTTPARVTEETMRNPLLLFRISLYGIAVSALWAFAVATRRLTGLIRFR